MTLFVLAKLYLRLARLDIRGALRSKTSLCTYSYIYCCYNSNWRNFIRY